MDLKGVRVITPPHPLGFLEPALPARKDSTPQSAWIRPKNQPAPGKRGQEVSGPEVQFTGGTQGSVNGSPVFLAMRRVPGLEPQIPLIYETSCHHRGLHRDWPCVCEGAPQARISGILRWSRMASGIGLFRTSSPGEHSTS
jgi:hypothetical protein